MNNQNKQDLILELVKKYNLEKSAGKINPDESIMNYIARKLYKEDSQTTREDKLLIGLKKYNEDKKLGKISPNTSIMYYIVKSQEDDDLLKPNLK